NVPRRGQEHLLVARSSFWAGRMPRRDHRGACRKHECEPDEPPAVVHSSIRGRALQTRAPRATRQSPLRPPPHHERATRAPGGTDRTLMTTRPTPRRDVSDATDGSLRGTHQSLNYEVSDTSGGKGRTNYEISDASGGRRT